MPYIFVDELADGQEEAQVYTPDDYNAIVGERDALTAERDSLRSELSEAKTRFAGAFLSAPQARQADQPKESYTPKTCSSLFE